MSAEETFRRVLTARLPAGPAWTAWIDGTVTELATADGERRTVERDTIRRQEQRIQAVLALCDEVDEPGYIETDDVRELLEGAP